MGLNLPIVFYRIPFFSEKQAFANRVIEQWNLTIHSFPPAMVGIVREPAVDVINYYSVGNGKTLLMPVGVTPPKEGLPFLCGLRDLLGTLRGIVIYPWDTVLIGHKSSDKDPLLGDIPLKGYSAKVSDSVRVLFPLCDFTDADIWTYTEAFNVPYNERRYNKGNGYQEFTDQQNNNDYYPACMKCMDPAEPAMVECPKFGVVPNVSAVVPVADLVRLPYMEEANAR
jgi:hypothetical protein